MAQEKDHTDLPNAVHFILLSGKRFTGKDYIGDYLAKEIKRKTLYNVFFFHATTALKKDFCQAFGLDYDLLISDRKYKETHRPKMTQFFVDNKEKWGETCYCQKILGDIERASGPTVFIMEIRYKFERDYYLSLGVPYTIVRVNVNPDRRMERGWTYSKEIDEHVSETELDDFDGFHIVFDNSYNGKDRIDRQIVEPLIKRLT